MFVIVWIVDSTAKEFDLQSGVELATYSGHPNNVQYVKFLESEETLLTASSYVVKLWDIRSGTCQKTLTYVCIYYVL